MNLPIQLSGKVKEIVMLVSLAIVGLIGFLLTREEKPILQPLSPDEFAQELSGDPYLVQFENATQPQTEEPQFGGTPKRPSEYKTTLAQSFTEGHSGTTLKVSSITLPDGNTLDPTILGDTVVLKISPGKSNREIVKCTGLTTATLTFSGCTFGMKFTGEDSGSSSLVKAHSPGETVLISDDDVFLNTQYASLDGTNVFTGFSKYASSSVDVVKLYFPDSPTSTDVDTYIWYNRTSGQIGFASSTSGELSWNTNGTTFRSVTPLSLSGGELKLATTTEFDLSSGQLSLFLNNDLTSGTSGLTINTSTPFIFADNFKVSNKVATGTLGFWAGSAGVADNLDLTGGDLYVQDSVEFDGQIFGGTSRLSIINSTTTNVGTLSVFTGHNLARATTTDLNFSYTGGTGEQTAWTYTVPAGSIGAYGKVKVMFKGTHTISAGTTGTWRVKIGGTTICTVADGTTTDTLIGYCEFANKGSQSVQFGLLVWGQEAGDTTYRAFDTPSNGAVDTSANTTITITTQADNNADTMTVAYVNAEITKITQE